MLKKPSLKTGNFVGAAQKPLSRSLRVYQKIAIVFVVVALMLLLAVLYLSISQANINIVPNPQVISANVSAEIASNVSSTSQIEGMVIQKTVEKAKLFQLPEEGATPVESKSGGMVTLINETNSDQPLVATTRLLSEEGVLFRIDEAVTVPANGQVETIAHADEVGSTGDVGPTQFTIPGLAESKQSTIYAVSVESMTGGVSYIRVLSQADLDQAKKDLSAEILEEAKQMLREESAGAGFDGESFSVDILTQTSDTEPGTESGSFTISVTARATGVFYSLESVAKYAATSLYGQVQKGFQVTSANEDGAQVTLQSVDAERAVATVNVYLDGFMIIAQNNEIFDKDKFTGKSPKEVVTVLESSDAISEVSVSFTPFWLKRIPTLKDHIKINIE